MPNAVVEDLQTPSAMNPTQDPLSPEIPVVEHPSGINAVSALNPMKDPFCPEITVEQDLQISSALDSGVRDPCNSSPAVENPHKQNSVVEEDPWIKQVLY